jgi:hypothetical protein
MAIYQTNIEIMKCGGCGRLGVAISDGDGCSTRITQHKCNGSWTLLSTQAGMIDTKDLKANATSELKKVNGEPQWVRRSKSAA